MKPVFQDKEGWKGDCFPSCVASILETEKNAEAVKGDWITKGNSQKIEDEWFTKLSEIYRKDGVTLKKTKDKKAQSGYYIGILMRNDNSGHSHAVVMKETYVVHNPSKLPFQYKDYYLALIITVEKTK